MGGRVSERNRERNREERRFMRVRKDGPTVRSFSIVALKALVESRKKEHRPRR